MKGRCSIKSKAKKYDYPCKKIRIKPVQQDNNVLIHLMSQRVNVKRVRPEQMSVVLALHDAT